MTIVAVGCLSSSLQLKINPSPMATSTSAFIHLLSHPKPIRVDPYPIPTRSTHVYRVYCTKTESDLPNPYPTSSPEFNNAETFPIEKRRKSVIIRERKKGLVKPEPKNLEIGWKRTKPIDLSKPKGYMIVDFLLKMEELMGRELFGSAELLAKTGEIVAERAREEAEVLREEGEVDERMVTELFRVLKLMEMDLTMVKAAVKKETLSERLEIAKARCRQAILVAQSF